MQTLQTIEHGLENDESGPRSQKMTKVLYLDVITLLQYAFYRELCLFS